MCNINLFIQFLYKFKGIVIFKLMEIKNNTNNTMSLNILTIIKQNLILQILIGVLLIISCFGYTIGIYTIYIKLLKKYCKCPSVMKRIKRKKDFVVELGNLSHQMTN
jgi:hypothetical protein